MRLAVALLPMLTGCAVLTPLPLPPTRGGAVEVATVHLRNGARCAAMVGRNKGAVVCTWRLQ